nr:type IV secretory system conjugative DNA transfer family protein [Oscillospiraceae bacterium]
MRDTRILGAGKSISNDTRLTGLNNNDLIIGPSGSGKTTGYVIPNIMRSESSIITADTKNTLYRMLAPGLKEKGYSVYVINFTSPKDSSSYNPLSYIPADGQKYDQRAVASIAHTLIPDSLDKNEKFWVISARQVLECIIGFVMEALVPKDRNMVSVIEILRLLCVQSTAGRASIPFLDEWALLQPDSAAVGKYRLFKASMTADKMWASIIQFVSSALDVFSAKEYSHMFRDRPYDFRINDLGRKKCAVFLNISDTDRSADGLVNVFYTQVMQVLCREADKMPDGRLEQPVRIILDDFASNAYIPDFDRMISVIRSREISVSVILQSLSQLEGMYTRSQSLTILNNCDHIVYLGGNDLATAEYVAARSFRTVENILCLDT